jgi:hypothetical protein
VAGPDAEVVAEPEAAPAVDDGPTEEVPFAPDTELLDRAEATYAGAASVIDLVDAGDLDQAESLFDSLVAPPTE